MTQTYYPFDTGAGANVTETQWADMAQHWLGTGVISDILNQLEVYADSTGMQVKVKSGACWIKGHYFKSDAEETLAIGTADPTNPRIDRVIVKLDWTNNNIQLAVLQGTPAATPTAPALTQNTSRWEVSLAQVSVGAGVTTIAAGNITDERVYGTDVYLKSGERTKITNAIQGLGERIEKVKLSQLGNDTSTITFTGTFDNAFSAAPIVVALPQLNVTDVVCAMLTSVTTTGFTIKLNRTSLTFNNTNTYSINVVAIGS